MIKKMIQQLIC